MRPVDVVIVGAGVIGACIAYTLSRSTRLRIRLIDRGAPGCEASGAAAGVLAVASARARRGALFELRRMSAAMYPDLVAGLEEETGLSVGYRSDGLISLALSEADGAALRELVAHRTAQGLRGALIESGELLQLEPAINPEVRAAALFPDDHAVDSECLVRGLIVAARQRGVELAMGTAVQGLGNGTGAVTVTLPNGRIEAGTAIVAAGAWSGEILARCGVKVPVRPIHGEMAALRPPNWTLRHTLTAGDGYLVPRANGEVLVGSTSSFVGFDKRVTPAGLATLRAHAAQMVPRAATTMPVRTWAGLRPCSTIHRPIIARVPEMQNLILATGHHRSGILLAPITAQMVCEMVTGVPSSVPLHPFSYRRR